MPPKRNPSSPLLTPELIASLADVDLQPWQRDLAERMMSGERVHFSLRQGRAAVVRHQLAVARALGYTVEEHDGYALIYEAKAAK